MTLIFLIGFLLGGGILAVVSARWSPLLPRWISLAAIGVDLVLAVRIWAGRPSAAVSPWYDEVDWRWIPGFGVHFHLAVDGLSLLMVMLTLFLGIISVVTSWTEIQQKVGFFHFNLMWVLAGIASVFVAFDLFLFYFAWELMLVPMYFLIVIWGHERRVYAGMKFFLFTQCSGLLMLVNPKTVTHRPARTPSRSKANGGKTRVRAAWTAASWPAGRVRRYTAGLTSNAICAARASSLPKVTGVKWCAIIDAVPRYVPPVAMMSSIRETRPPLVTRQAKNAEKAAPYSQPGGPAGPFPELTVTLK